MSNFSSLSLVTESLVGSAPSRFVGSTSDSLATILAAGYLNDINKKIKANDIFDINYADASSFPLNVGEAALYGAFAVQYDPVLGNWNLIPRGSQSSGISAYGVSAATFNNPGGSATVVVSDPNVNPNSIVIARWQSSVNASIVETVAPAAGSFTLVASADPGVSVLEYIVVQPSVPLQNLGVFAGQASSLGASATVVLSNPNITAAMEVQANAVSVTNASYIKTAICSAGTITLVFNTAPGACVINYMAILPSAALTALGLYGATYSNAGGSATTTITDANISASSIVVANWASQANASAIEKVTPGAGSLTILSSADPGASVLNYSATPAPEGSNEDAFLPLSGGQMTGSILLDRGTATSTAGAATINHQAGVITTEALTTASGSAYSFTLTNSRITASSIVLCQLMGGTNTKHGLSFTAVPSAGSCAISVLNNDISAAALNGTLIFGFVVI